MPRLFLISQVPILGTSKTQQKTAQITPSTLEQLDTHATSYSTTNLKEPLEPLSSLTNPTSNTSHRLLSNVSTYLPDSISPSSITEQRGENLPVSSLS
ncbi:hypothetical protein ANANG_G00089050 [Anguilla anguilla]|uniref:Uncharacterized protein n=1 Tax=Anguilla anguilla TaxID=7936 RepID=A0A9D3MPR1_ANGAN|nr:hypothetical protein ANANG_G00089050 [Anguilla anguilla]